VWQPAEGTGGQSSWGRILIFKKNLIHSIGAVVWSFRIVEGVLIERPLAFEVQVSEIFCVQEIATPIWRC